MILDCCAGIWVGGLSWIMIPIILVVFASIFLIFREPRPSGESKSGLDRDKPQQETPLEILEKRYAKGEITKEDFDRRISEIQP